MRILGAGIFSKSFGGKNSVIWTGVSIAKIKAKHLHTQYSCNWMHRFQQAAQNKFYWLLSWNQEIILLMILMKSIDIALKFSEVKKIWAKNWIFEFQFRF